MSAAERQLRESPLREAGEDSLEIAVEPARVDDGEPAAVIELDAGAFGREPVFDDERDEFDDGFVLEASDVFPVEVAREVAGLPRLPNYGELGGDGELVEIIGGGEFAEQSEFAKQSEFAEQGEFAEAPEEQRDEAWSAPAFEVAGEEDEQPGPDAGLDLDLGLGLGLGRLEEQDEGAANDEESANASAVADPIRVPLWSSINTLGYAVARGLRGMVQAPLVQLLAVGTMAVCMLLLGTTTLIFQNARAVVQTLGVDVPVTVFMDPEVDPEATLELAALLGGLPEVEAAHRVTPEEALARLEEGLGRGIPDSGDPGAMDREELLAGVDPSTLPDSIELDLRADVEPGFADALALRVEGMDGVEEVTVLGPWVQQVEDMLSTLRWLALGVGLLVSLACLAIVWSTIRLGVFARRSELSLLRLVGGTSRFVRGPFVVEGVLQGVLGTALALAGLWLAFDLIGPFLERGLALMFAAGSLQFFSGVQIAIALGFGAILGLIGSRAAVARYADA